MNLSTKLNIVTKSKYKGKSKFDFLKDIQSGDLLTVEIPLVSPGRGGNGLYQTMTSIKNHRTGEVFSTGLTMLRKYLDKIEFGNTSDMALYQFSQDCGRHGELSGVFIASAQEIENSIGKMMVFGDVLGKHSEITSYLSFDQLTILPMSDLFVDEWISNGLKSIGINPLNYIQEYNE